LPSKSRNSIASHSSSHAHDVWRYLLRTVVAKAKAMAGAVDMVIKGWFGAGQNTFVCQIVQR